MANYVLINNGVVKNSIVADSTFISSISANWAYCVDITSLDPKPGIGWLYNGSAFENPEKIYARVNAAVVDSIYWVHNDNLASQQSINQFVVLLEGVDPFPGIGWGYVNGVFIPI